MNNLDKKKIFDKTESMLGIIKEPFEFKHISGLRMFMHLEIFTKKPKFTAVIEFTNGMTSGSQTIQKDSMDDCYMAMRTFVEQLSEKEKP
jgi:hypothetical protein